MPDDAVRPSIDFDHECPEFTATGQQRLREFRESQTRPWVNNYGGYWLATRYADVLAIAQKPEVFRAGKSFDENGDPVGGASIPPIPKVKPRPNEADPPEWNNIRTFLNHRFTPQAVKAYEAKAKRFAAHLVDKVIETGSVDLVADMTAPLPALVTLDLFGLPINEWKKFSGLFHAITSIPRDQPAYMQAIRDLDYYVTQRTDEEIERRRQNPTGDMYSHLAHGEIAGQPIDTQLLRDIALNVIGGGVGTTTALLTNGLWHLSQNPADRERLMKEPELLPTACEEFMRFYTPVQGIARHAVEDVEINGWKIKKGERVMLATTCANRDPEMFEEPEKFKLDRMPNRHLGFGVGMHRCIGSFFARMMFNTIAQAVLKRMPDYKIIEDSLVPNPCVAISDGWVHARATFTPGEKVGVPLPTQKKASEFKDAR